jgi:hypothetical protein
MPTVLITFVAIDDSTNGTPDENSHEKNMTAPVVVDSIDATIGDVLETVTRVPPPLAHQHSIGALASHVTDWSAAMRANDGGRRARSTHSMTFLSTDPASTHGSSTPESTSHNGGKSGGSGGGSRPKRGQYRKYDKTALDMAVQSGRPIGCTR